MLAELQKQLYENTDVAAISVITRAPVMKDDEVETFFDSIKTMLKTHIETKGESSWSLIFASKRVSGGYLWHDVIGMEIKDRWNKAAVDSFGRGTLIVPNLFR